MVSLAVNARPRASVPETSVRRCLENNQARKRRRGGGGDASGPMSWIARAGGHKVAIRRVKRGWRSSVPRFRKNRTGCEKIRPGLFAPAHGRPRPHKRPTAASWTSVVAELPREALHHPAIALFDQRIVDRPRQHRRADADDRAVGAVAFARGHAQLARPDRSPCASSIISVTRKATAVAVSWLTRNGATSSVIDRFAAPAGRGGADALRQFAEHRRAVAARGCPRSRR